MSVFEEIVRLKQQELRLSQLLMKPKDAMSSLAVVSNRSPHHLFRAYLASGTEVQWNGMRICHSIYQPPDDRVYDPGLLDHQISLQITSQDYLERRFDGGKPQAAAASPGMLNFFPADRPVEFRWTTKVELLSVYLPPILLKQAALETTDRVPQDIQLIDRFAIRDLFLEQLLHTLKLEFEKYDATDALYLESLQTVLIGYLLRHHCTATITTTQALSGLSQSKLNSVLNYIHGNLDQQINLAALAAVAQVTVHHFGKLFKQSTGTTPHQYVMHCRIERAKQLLTQHHLSFAEISQQVGFYDQSHFIHVFRRQTGLTPKQYRSKL